MGMTDHVIVAEATRQLQFEDDLCDAWRRREAMLVLSPHGLRGIRPEKITVVGVPRGMTWHELTHEVTALQAVCPGMVLEYR